MEHINLLIGLIVVVLTIVGFFSGFFKWAREAIREKSRGGGHDIRIPTKTISIAPNPSPKSTHWHLGGIAGQPLMQVVGHFLVTNITDLNIIVPFVALRKPELLGFVTVKAVNSDAHGQFHIPPGHTTDLMFLLWITPPVKNPGETLKGDVALVDQFGNRHWLKNVEFFYQ
ncbi:MAG TPA: hypothetical protein VEI46_05990 [Thermodesulfovibrionales bacterium]|nr:hypothetical protein [Thermodesulfovibrionales bacterium]